AGIPDIETPIPPFDPAVLEALFQPPPPAKISIRRRDTLSEDEHRRRLALMPELNIDSDATRQTSRQTVGRAKPPPGEEEVYFTPTLLAARGDLAGLPMRKYGLCKLDDDAVSNLSARSRDLRRLMVDATDGADRPAIVAGTLRVNFYHARGDFKTCFGD